MFKIDTTKLSSLRADNKEDLISQLEEINLQDLIYDKTPEIHIEIYQDTDCESPLEYDGFDMISFKRFSTHFKDPEDLDWDDIKAKCERKEAFLLSCYSHGGESWGLQGEVMQCQFDTVNTAGILFLSDDLLSNWDKDELESREKAARSFMEEYTAWVNGECYGFNIECDDLDIDEGCGGFTVYNDATEEYFAEEIAQHLPEEDACVLNLTQSYGPVDVNDIKEAVSRLAANKAKSA